MGVFSVYREGMDRESLRCATQILAEGRRPLVLFPEGVISRTNDRLNNMMEGTVLVARSAAKQRAGLNPPGQVVIHPVAIRYFFDGDVLHRFTAPLHAYLLARPRVADRVLAVSSFFIDLFGIALIAPALFGGALTPFAALLLVFAFRQVCQGLCALQPPPDMIWRNPGFPSLLVTYGVSTDFFISGHTAIAVLGAITAAQHCPWYIGLAAGAIAFLEAATVIVLRAHYTLDVLGAIVAAWCANDLAARLLGG